MTTYVRITANARSFKINAPSKDRGDNATFTGVDNIRVTSDGNTRVTSNGDTRVIDTVSGYPFMLQGNKRSFNIRAPKRDKSDG